MWTKERKMWVYDDWKRVLFSEKSRFDICVGDCRKRIVHTKAKAYLTKTA